MPQLAYIPPTRQLQPIDLVAPGFRGLNTEQAGAVLPPFFATAATNAVLDSDGRLAARDGLADITVNVGAAVYRTVFEYIKADGTVQPIVTAGTENALPTCIISNSIVDPVANNIRGSIAVTSGTWHFQNFNDKVIGFQAGGKLIVWNGTGNFAYVTESSGTAPTGGVGCAAFGRIWQTDSTNTVVYYSGLLNETQWATGGAGQVDFKNIWTQGTDTITAIVPFNGSLLVFGKRHIVFLTDGKGSALGLDPNNLYVSDVIAGTGCVTQFSVQPIGSADLLFLSPNGVQSLGRLIVNRSNPISSISKNVRGDLLADLTAESDVHQIRSVYSPLHGFYLLSFPSSNRTWVFDQRRKYQDEDGDVLSVVTTWGIGPKCMFSRTNNQLLLERTYGPSIAGATVIASYSGDLDGPDTYRFVYTSPWLDLGEELANREKILKRLGAILLVSNNATVLMKWATNFSPDFTTETRLLPGTAATEWGLGEWGLSEFGGGLALRIIKIPARDRGQYFRIGIEADVQGEFAVQQAELFAKIGRLA